MFSYLGAKLGNYGVRIKPRNPQEALKNTAELYKKTNKDNVEILTSFVDRKPFKKVRILYPDPEEINSPVKRRAVLVEDLKTGNKTQINTETYLNTIYHKETHPNGRLQFSVSKVTIDKNGNEIEAKRNAYYKSPDGKSWIHYIFNDSPVRYDWNIWGKL